MVDTGQHKVRWLRIRRVGRRLWRIVASTVTVLVLLLLMLEATARLVYGLGDPPLTQDHPTIDYLLRPGQDARRFGNAFQTNAYGMRSAPFPLQKTDPTEVRILFLGDSVINGGSHVDQPDLATERLKPALSQALSASVVTANASTASWAPHNWLAYVEQFGMFDADLVVVLLNAGDLAPPETPHTTAGFQARFPRDPPFCALHDAWLRFGPRHLPAALAPSQGPLPDGSTPLSGHRRHPDPIQTLGLLHDAFDAAGVPMLLVYHPTLSEAQASSPSSEAEQAMDFAKRRGLGFVALAEPYRLATQGRPAELYRDSIHLHANGHAALARALKPQVLTHLRPVPPATQRNRPVD